MMCASMPPAADSGVFARATLPPHDYQQGDSRKESQPPHPRGKVAHGFRQDHSDGGLMGRQP